MKCTSLLPFGFWCLVASGCDDSQPVLRDAGPAVLTAAPAAPPIVDAAPAPLPKLVMSAGVSGIGVGGQIIDGKRADLLEAVAEAMGTGAFTISEPVEISIERRTPFRAVRALVAALRKHGEKQAVFKTAMRGSGALGSLPIVVNGGSLKSATATGIGKDRSIAVWPAAGGPARKKSHGFAGPDLTLGGKLLGDSVPEGGAIVFGSDDSVEWGLVFDLALTRVEYKNASSASLAIAAGAYEPGKKVLY